MLKAHQAESRSEPGLPDSGFHVLYKGQIEVSLSLKHVENRQVNCQVL